MRRFRSLLAGLLLTGVCSAESPWVVVVGIDDYVNPSLPDLRYAGADAKLIAQSVSQLLGVSKDRLFLFTTDAAEPTLTPTRANIIFRLDWLRTRVSASDTVVFFFAGHGLTVDGESFLLTEESDNRSLVTLKSTALSARDLNAVLRSSPARQSLMVLDACRNDPGAAKGLDSSLYSAVSLASPNQEKATLYSCSLGQKSWEWEQQKHGFFSYYFYEGLRQGAVQPDGAVSLQSLSEYLHDQVPQATNKAIKEGQMPTLSYEGPSTRHWVLARSKAPAGLASGGQGAAQLQAAQARGDLAELERAEWESRLRLEETRRKQVEARLAAVEKGLTAPPSSASEEIQRLTLARDLALKELIETRKQLDEVKAQRSVGVVPDLERQVVEAERDHLKSVNKLLQSRISVLEGQLDKQGISFARSAASPESDQVDALRSRAVELNRQLQETTQSAQKALSRSAFIVDPASVREDELASQAVAYLESEVKRVGIAKSKTRVELTVLEIRAALPQSAEDTATVSVVALEKALQEYEDELSAERAVSYRHRETIQKMLKNDTYRSTWVSRYFHKSNRLPGMGDLIDIPLTRPEATEL